MLLAAGYVILGAAVTLWIAEWISRVLGAGSVLTVVTDWALDPLRYVFWWIGDVLRRATLWLGRWVEHILANLCEYARAVWDALWRLVRFLKFRELYRALVDTWLVVLSVPIAPAQILRGFVGVRFRRVVDGIRATRKFFGRKTIFALMLPAIVGLCVYLYRTRTVAVK